MTSRTVIAVALLCTFAAVLPACSSADRGAEAGAALTGPASRPTGPVSASVSWFPVELRGHTDVVTHVAFLPDPDLLLSTGADHTVRLWSVSKRKELRRYVGHTKNVCSLSVAPDGKTFATGAQDDTVRLWRVDSGDPTAVITVTTRAPGVLFSPDGGTLAISDSEGTESLKVEDFAQVIRLWNLKDGRDAGRLRVREIFELRLASFSRDGSRLLALFVSDDIDTQPDRWAVWDVAKRERVAGATFPSGIGQAMAARFTPDAQHVLTTGGGMGLWDVATGKRVRYWPLGEGGIGVSPSGRVIATCGFMTRVTLWDARTFDKLTSFGTKFNLAPGAGGTHPAFSPDGKRLAVGDSDNLIRVWDVTEKETR